MDESDISERLTRVRIWAPKGQKPVIQFDFNLNHVSVIAGLTRTNCQFRLHEGSVKMEEIVEFLEALKAQFRQSLLVVWGRWKTHRSRLLRDYLDTLNGQIRSPSFRSTRPISIPSNTCGPGSATSAGRLLSTRLSQHAKARDKHKSAQKRPSIIAAC